MIGDRVLITRTDMLECRTNSAGKEEQRVARHPIALLRLPVAVQEDVLVGDICGIVRDNYALSEFLAQYSWCKNIDQYHAELDQLPSDDDCIDYIELYRTVTFTKATKTKDAYTSVNSLIGVGRPSSTLVAKKAVKSDDEITYSIASLPLTTLFNKPIRIKHEVDFYRINPKTSTTTLTKTTISSFTLLELLDAIYWEMSYCQ